MGKLLVNGGLLSCVLVLFFVAKGCLLMFNDVFQYNDVLSKSHLLVITSDLTMISL